MSDHYCCKQCGQLPNECYCPAPREFNRVDKNDPFHPWRFLSTAQENHQRKKKIYEIELAMTNLMDEVLKMPFSYNERVGIRNYCIDYLRNWRS